MSSAAEIAAIEERLRQERETFDQRKHQEATWFNLRLRMGYTAVVMLPAIAIVCVYVIFSSEKFDSGIVTLAGTALLVDVLGLVISVFKLVLQPGAVDKLDPITKDKLN